MAEARAASAPDAQNTMETDDAKMADATTTRLREGQVETTVRQNPSARAAWVPERELCTTQTEPDIGLPQAADAKCRHGTRPGSCPHYIRWRRRPALSEIDRTNDGASQQPDVSKCGIGTETTGLLLSSLQNKASTFGKTWHTGIRASDTPDTTEVQPVTRPRLIRPPSPSRSPLCQADENTPLTPACLYQPQSILPAFLVPNLHINYALTFDPRLHPGLLRRRSTQGEIVTYNINGAKKQKPKVTAYSACWRKPAMNK
jgi:hypothetical protein